MVHGRRRHYRPIPKLKKIWALIKERGPALGLHLNPSKCEFTWLDPSCELPCPIRLDGVNEEGQIKLIPFSEVQMLGVPLGDGKFVADFVEKKLLGRLGSTINQLVDFEDSQSAFYLLRVSFSIVRAVHFMRTTPLEHWKDQATKFDLTLRRARNRSWDSRCRTPPTLRLLSHQLWAALVSADA